jgi:hypothetical protein
MIAFTNTKRALRRYDAFAVHRGAMRQGAKTKDTRALAAYVEGIAADAVRQAYMVDVEGVYSVDVEGGALWEEVKGASVEELRAVVQLREEERPSRVVRRARRQLH